MDSHTELGYIVNPPHQYMTQDLANEKVRLFAVEMVQGESDNDWYDNLRAVTTLEWDYGLDLVDFLNELMDEINEEATRLEGEQRPGTARSGPAGRPSADSRAHAVRKLGRAGQRWPARDQVLGFSVKLPTAVRTAVLAELATQGIDEAAVIEAAFASASGDR